MMTLIVLINQIMRDLTTMMKKIIIIIMINLVEALKNEKEKDIN
jgi:hypothetical protein